MAETSRLKGRRQTIEESGRPFAVNPASADFDWLAVAIGNMGGVAAAAEKIGVSAQTVYTWLAQGVGTLSFGRVVQIAELGRIPLEAFKQRMGPVDLTATEGR